MSKYIFLKKKIILGKTKKIYTKKGSKKEYVKYKNLMINVAKYKKIKNYNSKKMKGGVKGPPRSLSIYRRHRSLATIGKYLPHLSKEKSSEEQPSEEQPSEKQPSRKSHIKFGIKQVRIIPSNEENRDHIVHYITNSMSNFNLTTTRPSRPPSSRPPSSRRTPSYLSRDRPGPGPLSLRNSRPPSRPYERPPSRRSKRPPSILRRRTSVPPTL